MAPEVIRQERYGMEADVYSFGCVLVSMATRKPPYSTRQEAVYRLMNLVAEGKVAPTADLSHRRPGQRSWPEELVGLVESCVAPDPGDRSTFPLLARDLSAHVRESPNNVRESHISRRARGSCSALCHSSSHKTSHSSKDSSRSNASHEDGGGPRDSLRRIFRMSQPAFKSGFASIVEAVVRGGRGAGGAAASAGGLRSDAATNAGLDSAAQLPASVAGQSIVADGQQVAASVHQFKQLVGGAGAQEVPSHGAEEGPPRALLAETSSASRRRRQQWQVFNMQFAPVVRETITAEASLSAKGELCIGGHLNGRSAPALERHNVGGETIPPARASPESSQAALSSDVEDSGSGGRMGQAAKLLGTVRLGNPSAAFARRLDTVLSGNV